MASGDYDVHFDTDRADEFGDLNRTLSATRDTLSQRFEEIQENERTLRERSKMVGVLNRVLRHNVRNDINVIAGRAELAAQEAQQETVREQLDAIRETAMDLAALSDRTKRIQQLVTEEGFSTAVFALPGRLETALAGVRSKHPDATVSVHVSSGVVPVETADTLPQALADVVEDIIANNAREPAVDITIRPTPDNEWVVVTVDDDGKGLPKLDVVSVDEGKETPLKHAEGVSLWSLSWSVSKTAGNLNVNPGDATLELRLPAATERSEET